MRIDSPLKVNRIKVFLKDPNKKSVLQIIKEVIILTIMKRELPFYYFKYAYRKTVTNYLDYLSLKEQNKLKIHPDLHNPEYIRILDNKLFFSLLSKSTSTKTPELISYNLKSSFSYRNKITLIYNEQDLVLFYKKLFEENNINGLFFRPPSENSGKGCFKVTKLNYENEIKKHAQVILNSNYVHTEVIKQHELINRIHSTSINTLRMITLITSSGDIEIVSVFMRFGVGDSVVDNASSGGFFVGINLDDGTLKSRGHFLPQFGGEEITEHPESGFKFEGFSIPYYREACEIITNAVKVIPNRFIGWDVAICPNGPVIIEANTQPHLQMSNIAYGGLLKNKYVKKVMSELN